MNEFYGRITDVKSSEGFVGGEEKRFFIDFKIDEEKYYMTIKEEKNSHTPQFIYHNQERNEDEKICILCRNGMQGLGNCTYFDKERLRKLCEYLLDQPSIKIKAIIKGIIKK